MINEVAKKKREVVLPGYLAKSTRMQLDFSIGITGMPAGVGGVIVSRIVHVPAKSHITEPQPAIEQRNELFDGKVFAT